MFLLNRAVMAAVTLVGVAVVVFFLLRVVPGDPIAIMISPGASPADIKALRALYGLDAGPLMQFWLWVKAMASGEFGTSISLKRDVLALLCSRLPPTIELALAALVFALLTGGGIAVIGTLARGRPLESAIDGTTGLLLAVPDFVWALALVLVLGVFLPVLPLSGRVDPALTTSFRTPFYLLESIATGRFGTALDILAHMTMPVLSLGLPLAAVIARLLKASLSEAMTQDYVLLARLKGMSEVRLVLREALRNAVGPTVALTGVQFTFLIGGTVVIERIFAYPGIGNLAIDAVINRDLPLIQGIVLTFGALFVLVNILVDLLAVVLNPRLGHG